MTKETKNPPVDTIRYGALKAVIWSNPGKDDRPRYSVTYSRSYITGDGTWKDTSSFGEIDCLKLAHLIPKVLDRITALKHGEPEIDDEGDEG